MSKNRVRKRTPKPSVRRSPAAPGAPTSTTKAPSVASDQQAAEALIVDLLESFVTKDDQRVGSLLARLLALPPSPRDRRDPAGMSAADLLCEELERQSSDLWSDLAGPLSLDPLVDRFLPLVQQAEGPHRADLGWVLEFLRDGFRLSTAALRKVDGELRSMTPVRPPLAGASGMEERADRLLRLLLDLAHLINSAPALPAPDAS